MRSYILYKDKSVKGFKRLVTAGGGIFDKYRSMAASFIRYAGSDLDKKLSQYDAVLNLNSIQLEQVFPVKYKWMVSNRSFASMREYLKEVENRITEFEGGKEDNLKIMVGILFLRFVLVTKVVETYLSSAVALKEAGNDVSNLTLDKIGIGKSILKYFDAFEELSAKEVGDWLAVDFKDGATPKYFYSSMKRILSIILGDDSSF